MEKIKRMCLNVGSICLAIAAPMSSVFAEGPGQRAVSLEAGNQSVSADQASSDVIDRFNREFEQLKKIKERIREAKMLLLNLKRQLRSQNADMSESERKDWESDIEKLEVQFSALLEKTFEKYLTQA